MKNLTANFSKVAFILATLQLAPGIVVAAMTDIGNAPLATASNSNVKPNILFVLDDSGSMSWNYMPDSVFDYVTGQKKCFGYYENNKIFYNPNTTYNLPVKDDGSLFASSDFTNAPVNGFDPNSPKVDLSNLSNISSYYNPERVPTCALKNDGSGNWSCLSTKFYYANLIAGKSADCTNTNYQTVTDPSILTPEQKTNYANWYSYYRTRTLTMRSGVGKAFVSMTDRYRIGFTVINETTFDESSDLSKYSLHVRDFDITQKQEFFKRLYKAPSTGSTPLRGSLSKAGRYFAKNLNNQSYDPIQYSCQQNFVILSTDGYWNNGREYDDPYNGVASYGPFKLKSSAGTLSGIGNEDSSANSTPRPYLDDYKSSNSASACMGVTGGSGVFPTLADVSMYYYKTDIRNSALNNCTGALGEDVCDNNVPGVGDDLATYQHLTLFTLGLGVDGLLSYSDDYKQGGSTSYNNIVAGKIPWPDAKNCTQGSRIDDLWHAAVNGRGTYFSAKSPAALTKGLGTALSAINSRIGASAAAATSNLEPVAGDNFIYVALYRTVNWDGDLKAFTIDPQTGAVSTTSQWSAQQKLDAKVAGVKSGDGRNIYMFSNATTSKLRDFNYANLGTEGKASFFDSMCGASPKLSQCAGLTTTQQGMLSGQNLVNFLRGQDTYEDQGSSTDRLYRDREHVLGDMITAVPVYLKKPPFAYADYGYGNFVNNNATRAPTVFVAANDGMLHAFDAETGEERWAFIPTAMLEKLHKLADFNYSSNHLYFVDGSPTVADICTANCGTGSAVWKTILVGGFNAGGRGYYALDVTDPTSPKGLWEFTHNDLGLSFGNPVVTKNKAGTWVVMFASGYNNVSPGDGNGHLFVLNATSGAIVSKIATNDGNKPAGSTTTPSGLAKINAWVETAADNTALRVYGGDLLGNLWRFDFDDLLDPAGNEAVKLAGFEMSGNPQPITTKPELASVKGNTVVFVGTGRYLGITDLSNVEQQSIYAIKDLLGTTGIGNARQGSQLVQQTLTESTNAEGRLVRTASKNAVNWTSSNGWYIDLNPGGTSAGERVNIEMQQQYNILTVATNVPNPNACNVGGYGYLYNIDIETGGGLSTAAQGGTEVGVRLSTNALVAGVKVVKLTTGKTVAIVTDTTGTITVESMPSPTGSAAGSVKRTMWREITN